MTTESQRSEPYSVCSCGHAVIDHRRYSDHDECQISDCECDRVRPQPQRSEQQEWTPVGKFEINIGAETFTPKCYDTGSRDLILDAHKAALATERQLRRNAWTQTRDLDQQLLSALAAIEKHNKSEWSGCVGTKIDVDLSILHQHDAEVRKDAFTEGWMRACAFYVDIDAEMPEHHCSKQLQILLRELADNALAKVKE